MARWKKYSKKKTVGKNESIACIDMVSKMEFSNIRPNKNRKENEYE